MTTKAEYKVGDEVVWAHDLSDPSTVRSGTITKLSDVYCWVNNQHKYEDCLYLSYCWPIRVNADFNDIIRQRAKLKSMYDDSMKLFYELRNAIARGEK